MIGDHSTKPTDIIRIGRRLRAMPRNRRPAPPYEWACSRDGEGCVAVPSGQRPIRSPNVTPLYQERCVRTPWGPRSVKVLIGRVGAVDDSKVFVPGTPVDPVDEVRDMLDVLPGAWARFSRAQKENALTIYRAFDNEPLRVIQAAIVNALRESGLHSALVTGNEIGLFQIDRNTPGVDPTKLFDPYYNTQMIYRVFRGPAGDVLRDALTDNASGEEIAVLFMRDVDRPADRLPDAAGNPSASESRTRTIFVDLFGIDATPKFAEGYPVYTPPAVSPSTASVPARTTNTSMPPPAESSGIGLGGVLIGIGVLVIGVAAATSGGR